MTLTVLSGGCTRLFTWIMRQSDVLPQNILKNWPSVQVWTVLHTLVPCPFCSNVSVQQAALQGSLRELREMNAFRLFLQPIRQGLSVFSGKWDCFWVCLFFFPEITHFCGHCTENYCPCWCLKPAWLHHQAVIEYSMSFTTCSVSFSLEMTLFKKALMAKGSSWSSLFC